MTKIELNTVDPNAVCNDGTPAIYFWKESPNKSNDWLLFFEGGGNCWSAVTCEARRFNCHLSSSRCDDNTMMKGGVFGDQAENPLRNANKAFLRYCSSDVYVGTKDHPHVMGFHGYSIVMAFVNHLIAH